MWNWDYRWKSEFCLEHPGFAQSQAIAWHKIGIEHFLSVSILTCVKSLRTLLTLVLVGVWPLVTTHCDLEQLPGLAFLACADEAETTHAEKDCETDTCASVESGFYKTEDTQPVVPTPPLVPSELLTSILLSPVEPASFQIQGFDLAPPELPKSWQFSFRTALPPRAPSLVS